MSGSLHAWRSLHDLTSLAGRKVALSGKIDICKLPRLASLLYSDVGSVEATLRFQQRRDGWLGVELDYRGTAELKCQRCFGSFLHAMEDRVDLVVADGAALPSVVPAGFEPYELMDGRLSPAELIEDELIVSIPLVPRHARVEDCGGLVREWVELD